MADMRNSPQDVASYLRKVRKPLVERQRRERMNASINRLKLLIADTIREQVSSMTRVDKADILELTVFHLTRLQQRQRAVSIATDATEDAFSATSYQTGYRDYAREAVTYLSSSSHCGPKVATSVNGHLRTVYEQKQNSSQAGKDRLQEVHNRIPQIENRVPFTFNSQAVFMSTPRRSNEGLTGLTGQIPTTSSGTLECSPILRMTKCHDDVIMHNSSTSNLSFMNTDSGFASFDMTTDIQSCGSDGCFSFDRSYNDPCAETEPPPQDEMSCTDETLTCTDGTCLCNICPASALFDDCNDNGDCTDLDPNTECVATGHCACRDGFSEIDGYCWAVGVFGGRCDGDGGGPPGECDDGTCPEDTNSECMTDMCICKDGFSLAGGVCRMDGSTGGCCGEEDTCMDKLAVCLDGLCVCADGSRAISGWCRAGGALGGMCAGTGNNECFIDKFAVCDNGMCVCKTGSSGISGMCRPNGWTGGICDGAGGDGCSGDMNAFCINGMCMCIGGYIPSSGVCVKLGSLGGPCMGNACPGDIMATCQSGMCMCNTNSSGIAGMCVPNGGPGGICVSGKCPMDKHAVCTSGIRSAGRNVHEREVSGPDGEMRLGHYVNV
ncbi:HES1-like protein [Mya arenaria]|uniref:HES1-like protein n=1 Tax=Mya arenaria TaxID=6604 RepID=A0ABY7FA69_MYAAR|nr:HES1-like protein [Mya arenaria]